MYIIHQSLACHNYTGTIMTVFLLMDLILATHQLPNYRGINLYALKMDGRLQNKRHLFNCGYHVYCCKIWTLFIYDELEYEIVRCTLYIRRPVTFSLTMGCHFSGLAGICKGNTAAHSIQFKCASKMFL